MDYIFTFVFTALFLFAYLLPGFIFIFVIYAIFVLLFYFLFKNFFVSNKKRLLFFALSYILMCIIYTIYSCYPKIYDEIDGVLINNNGPMSQVLVTRNMLSVDEKVSGTTDKDGKISFPSRRTFIKPLSTEFSEEYIIKYKDRDLSFSLSMPYTEPAIIETQYDQEDEDIVKFKINVDNLYTFWQNQSDKK